MTKEAEAMKALRKSRRGGKTARQLWLETHKYMHRVQRVGHRESWEARAQVGKERFVRSRSVEKYGEWGAYEKCVFGLLGWLAEKCLDVEPRDLGLLKKRLLAGLPEKGCSK